MTVDALTGADRDAAVGLWSAAGLVRPWNDPAGDFDRALAGTTSTVLGWRGVEGALAGTVMVGDDGHRGWLYYLAVAPAHRRAGVGRALVVAAERWLAVRGVSKVQLMIRAGNEQAWSFYRALGYDAAEVAVAARWLS